MPIDKENYSSFQFEVSDNKGNSSFQLEEYFFFDENDEVWMTRRNLPHVSQKEVIYFVTFRLNDSIPKNKAKEIEDERKLWVKMHKKPYSKEDYKEYFKLFSDRIENLLDSGHGSCLLRIPENKVILENALNYFHGKRYLLDEYIVMPNHVHILIKPLEENSIKSIMHSLKSYTANLINKRMGLSGKLWMHESFDHMVRSEEALIYLREYIRNNPKKRK